MKIEEQLRSAIRDYADRIEPDRSAWSRIDAGMTGRPRRQWRPLIMGAAAIAAVVAIVMVQLMGPSTKDPNGFVTDPTGEPKVTIVREGTDHVIETPEGDWRFRIPVSWRFHDGDDPMHDWFATSYTTDNWGDLTPEEQQKAILAGFRVDVTSEGKDAYTLVQENCPTEPQFTAITCQTRTIHGFPLAWIVYRTEDTSSEIGGPFQKIRALIPHPDYAGGRLYTFSATLWGNYEEGMAVVEQIVQSFSFAIE